MKYYHRTRDDFSGIDILAYDETNGIRNFKSCVLIYSSTVVVDKLFNTLEEAIKDLGAYKKSTTLPSGKVIQAINVNYPNNNNILKRVLFPLVETM